LPVRKRMRSGYASRRSRGCAHQRRWARSMRVRLRLPRMGVPVQTALRRIRSADWRPAGARRPSARERRPRRDAHRRRTQRRRDPERGSETWRTSSDVHGRSDADRVRRTGPRALGLTSSRRRVRKTSSRRRSRRTSAHRGRPSAEMRRGARHRRTAGWRATYAQARHLRGGRRERGGCPTERLLARSRGPRLRLVLRLEPPWMSRGITTRQRATGSPDRRPNRGRPNRGRRTRGRHHGPGRSATAVVGEAYSRVRESEGARIGSSERRVRRGARSDRGRGEVMRARER